MVLVDFLALQVRLGKVPVLSDRALWADISSQRETERHETAVKQLLQLLWGREPFWNDSMVWVKEKHLKNLDDSSSAWTGTVMQIINQEPSEGVRTELMDIREATWWWWRIKMKWRKINTRCSGAAKPQCSQSPLLGTVVRRHALRSVVFVFSSNSFFSTYKEFHPMRQFAHIQSQICLGYVFWIIDKYSSHWMPKGNPWHLDDSS